MADRVSASIVIGGSLSADSYAQLLKVVTDEGLSSDWDEGPFEPADRVVGKPLRLCAHEVAWGRFQSLEDWLLEAQLPFVRWAGSCAGSFGAERVIATGDGMLRICAVTDDDIVVLDSKTIDQLGSMEAIRAFFTEADFTVPALHVEGDPAGPD